MQKSFQKDRKRDWTFKQTYCVLNIKKSIKIPIRLE